MSRYLKREKAVNGEEQYKKLFDKRGVKQVTQYRSPKATYVSDEKKAGIQCYDYSWTYGDSFEGLAQRFYGNPREWWVIASFNNTPTESHVSIGQVLRIPISLADALQVVQ
jgi:nucleoid-associated protein YgaU